NVRGRHEYISDLEIKLNYQGTSSILISDLCNDEDNFNLGFDDQSDLEEIKCPPIDQEIYLPLTPLDVFNGSFAGGQWDLSIEDFAFLDGGEFQEWTLELCFTNASIATLVPQDHRLNICNDEPLLFSCYLDKQGLQDYTVKMWDENSEELSIQFTVEDNYLLIELSDGDQLPADSYVRLELIDINKNTVVSSSVINVVKVLGIAAPEIITPVNDSQLTPWLFNRIEWTADEDRSAIVQIATDEDFNDIILNQSVKEGNFLELEEELPEGDYYLRVALDNQGCLVYSSTIAVSLNLGTSTVDQEVTDLKLYPNPSYDKVYIKNVVDENAVFTIFNAKGQKMDIRSTSNNRGIKEFDINGLTQGVYFVRFVSEDLMTTFSFVKI
ncbi:MAG: T9SS type A sorting domain-containing protein, partial [Saprospiraceae bacterium]|nr:T9SS type A sorting domain-containing protein [Saprospiraceae bacterium]